MVNNSTYITQKTKTKPTTNSHFKPLNTRKTKTYGVGNPGVSLGQAYNVMELNRIMESPPSPLDNWIFNDKTDI